MKTTVSPLFGTEGKQLVALRKLDPERNLTERWTRLVAARPDFEVSYGFVPMIIDVGWAVVSVPADGVAYTVGLKYGFGQKDLLIVAPHLTPYDQKLLLNGLAHRVIEGERFTAGAKVTLEDGSTITFQKYEDATFSEHPCGYLARFEQFFEDRAHLAGGTLPVLWAELTKSTRVSTVKKRAVTKASSPARSKRRV